MGRPKPPTTEFTPTALPDDHRLVVLGPPKGSNNFESTDTEGVERLVEIGMKLRKVVLATRGDFAIVRLFPSSPEPKAGSTQRKSRLAGEIISLLTSKEIKDFKKAGEWPEGFGESPAVEAPTRQDPVEDLIPSDGMKPVGEPTETDEGYESDDEG